MKSRPCPCGRKRCALNEKSLRFIPGGQLPAGTLLSRNIRRAVLQLHAGTAVPVEKRMGGHEQEQNGRQVRRQSGRRRRQSRRDEHTGASRDRSHVVAGKAHFQHR